MSLQVRVQALADFLPLFEEPAFVFGTWHKVEQEEKGRFVMPHFDLSKTASLFVGMAYDQGWILTDFDWPTWKGTEEAIALRDNPSALERASPDQLAKLLTVVIRQDRFVEGALNGAFELGLLTAIIRRAEELVEQDDKGNQ